MKKYVLLLATIISLCLISFWFYQSKTRQPALDMDSCQEILEDYLVQSKVMTKGDGLLLSPIERSKLLKIKGESAYFFELRAFYLQGEHLIANYAITQDGRKIYYINPAMEHWELLP